MKDNLKEAIKAAYNHGVSRGGKDSWMMESKQGVISALKESLNRHKPQDYSELVDGWAHDWEETNHFEHYVLRPLLTIAVEAKLSDPRQDAYLELLPAFWEGFHVGAHKQHMEIYAWAKELMPEKNPMRKNPTLQDKVIGEYKGVLIWRNAVNGMFYALRVGSADTLKGMYNLINKTLHGNPINFPFEVVRYSGDFPARRVGVYRTVEQARQVAEKLNRTKDSADGSYYEIEKKVLARSNPRGVYDRFDIGERVIMCDLKGIDSRKLGTVVRPTEAMRKELYPRSQRPQDIPVRFDDGYETFVYRGFLLRVTNPELKGGLTVEQYGQGIKSGDITSDTFRNNPLPGGAGRGAEPRVYWRRNKNSLGLINAYSGRLVKAGALPILRVVLKKNKWEVLDGSWNPSGREFSTAEEAKRYAETLVTKFRNNPHSPAGSPAVQIGREVKALEYYDEKKATAEGLRNPGTPWRHDYTKGGNGGVYGVSSGAVVIAPKGTTVHNLPDGSAIIKGKGKRKLWGYR